MNFDGRITEDDAQLVLEEYTRIAGGQPGTFTPEQFAAADMDDRRNTFR